MRSRSGGLQRRRGAERFLLTRGNITIAVVTTGITIATLGYGLRIAGSVTDAATDDSARRTPQPTEAASVSLRGGMAEYVATTSPSTPPTGTTPRRPSPTSGSPTAGPAMLDSLTARGGPSQVVVSWRLSGATTSQIRATISGHGIPATACVPTTTGCTFSPLTDGVTYTVDVSLTLNGMTVTRRKATAIPYPAVLAARTTRLWFDPADPGNLIVVGGRKPTPGATVRRLLDRSGSGADARTGPELPAAQHHDSQRPPRPTFSAVSGLSFPASSLPSGSAPTTVYAVAALNDATAETDCIAHVLFWGTPHTNATRTLIKGCGTSLAFADTFNTWQEAAPTRSWRSGRPQIIRADFTARALSVWMDGASSYTWKQTAGANLDTKTAVNGMVGEPWDANSGWKGQIRRGDRPVRRPERPRERRHHAISSAQVGTVTLGSPTGSGRPARGAARGQRHGGRADRALVGADPPEQRHRSDHPRPASEHRQPVSGWQVPASLPTTYRPSRST